MKKTVCLLLVSLMLFVSGCAAEEKELRIEPQPVEGRPLQTEYVFPAEYSFEGTVFWYGGRSYDLAARTEGITGILSAVPAGETIVLECHAGPKNGIYCIFDTVDQTFEKEIAGNHLTWHSDDVTTAVYAFWSDIYTYDGTLVKSYPLAENEFIRSLRFSDDHTKLHVGIWQSSGTERTDSIPL